MAEKIDEELARLRRQDDVEFICIIWVTAILLVGSLFLILSMRV